MEENTQPSPETAPEPAPAPAQKPAVVPGDNSDILDSPKFNDFLSAIPGATVVGIR